MSLIKCPDCGKEISDKAGACPHCGYPIADKSKLEDESGKTKCPHCGKMVTPIVTNVGGGSCTMGSREKWTCPSCRRIIQSKGCFVATAVYGNEDIIEVRFLRAFRDEYLNNNFLGKLFIWLYYRFASYPAYITEKVPFLKSFARHCLDEIVKLIERKTSLKRRNFK